MSDVPIQKELAPKRSSRWQIPLLICCICLILLKLWFLYQDSRALSFEQLYDRAVALKSAGFLPEAGKGVQYLLSSSERSPEQESQLHLLMAEIIYARESSNTIHSDESAIQILEHSQQALAPGRSHDPEMNLVRSFAWEWLNQPDQALAECQQALAGGVDNVWETRKRIIEIKRAVGGTSAEEFHRDYDGFLSADGVDDELRCWAMEQKIELYARQDKHQRAQQCLADHVGLFEDSARKSRYDYLQALVWFHNDRAAKAEQLLRSLRDRLVPSDNLYAQSGWLLGQILQKHEKHEEALNCYRDVVIKCGPGPYRTASMFGQARMLAGLGRHDQAIEAFARSIEFSAEDSYCSKVDLHDIRKSTTAIYHQLHGAGELEGALGYLKLSTGLVPTGHAELQAVYVERLANLYFELGKSSPASERGGQHLRAAAERYLQLSKLLILNEPASFKAVRQAADAFDLAGEPMRSAEVLETLLEDRPQSSYVPEVLHRLGRTYQTLGRYDRAIEKYRMNLQNFPQSTPASLCIVPLGDCLIDAGQFRAAERVLMRVIKPGPAELLKKFSPQDEIYKRALAKLGDVYLQQHDYEKAVTRYRQALNGYEEDFEAYRIVFKLADACRKSAAEIRKVLVDCDDREEGERLQVLHNRRLGEALELFDRSIDIYGSRPKSSWSNIDHLYAKLSYFYRADAGFDFSLTAEPTVFDAYARSVEMYEQAVAEYQSDPMAVSAYVQMINCYLRMRCPLKARSTLNAARWALAGISDEQLSRYSPERNRSWWLNYLTILEQSNGLSFAKGEDIG